jgi:hypothetical protein
VTVSSDKIEKLVLVVHGVGDPTPGSTVAALARALADPENPLVHLQESLWLQEASADSKYLTTYPTYRCRLENRTQSVEFAEVYWGDLSRVCQGWLGAVIGLFQILFGLRYVAYAAADQQGRFSIALKRLGIGIERILQGPVLAITAMMLVLTTMLCAAEILWPGASKNAQGSRLLVLFSCIFAYSVAWISWRMSRSRIFERFWFWLKVTAVFVGTVCVVRVVYLDGQLGNRIEHQFSGVYWYCRLLVCFLGSLWCVEILLMLLLAASALAACCNSTLHRRAIHVAALLPTFSVGLWSLGLILFWLLAADRIEKFMGLAGFREIFKNGIPLLGVQFVMSGVIGTSILFSLTKYLIWRNVNGVRDYERGSRAPRLLVDGQVLFTLALSAVIGSTLVMVTQSNHWLGHNYHDYWYGKLLAECNKYALSMLLPAGFLAVFALPKLRPVFGIVLEIVNHFRFQSKDQVEGLKDDDQFDVRRTTFENGTMIFARRELVMQRMKRVLMYYSALVHQRQQPIELIVIGHSQGTMVAIEVLNSPDMDCLNAFSRVSLVTMGSPFTNLYQFYFPNFYPSLESRYWRRIKQRVNQWTNVFRIDDPVGTEIHFPANPASAIQPKNPNTTQTANEAASFICSYMNLPIGCRGHMNYWNDREVLGILRSDVFRSEWEAHVNAPQLDLRKAA